MCLKKADIPQVNFRVMKIEIRIISFPQRVADIKYPGLCLEGHPQSGADERIVQMIPRHIVLAQPTSVKVKR